MQTDFLSHSILPDRACHRRHHVLLVPLALMQDNPIGVLKTFSPRPFGSIRHMGTWWKRYRRSC